MPGITSSLTRNLPEECLFLKDEDSTEGMGFHRELPDHLRGIQPREGIPPLTSSLTLMQTGEIKMLEKLSGF
jgi:hypothetical protein